MQILIISGFLGSGKTSLLIPFVKRLTSGGTKIAIIENEIGERGVDDQLLKKNGFYVKEIYHGCICCSLRTNLLDALVELERDYTPDVVVMEPTGVADPLLILSTLSGYPGKINSTTMVSVVDAERFEDIAELKTPLVVDGIQCADLIALNKIDLISTDQLTTLTTKIHSMNPNPEIQPVSAYDQKLKEQLFDRIELLFSRVQNAEEQARLVLEKKGVLPSVYSTDFEFSSDEICLSEFEIRKYFEDRVYKTALLLGEAGAELIGNIKLIIRSDTDGYLLISTTSFSRFPEVTGRFPAGYSRASFTLNCMVYGIEQDKLEAVISKTFPHQSPGGEQTSETDI